MKTLYFDCFSGISGDMSVAAMIDIGAEFDLLTYEMNQLFPDKSANLSITKAQKCGMSALKFDVNEPFPKSELNSFADIKQFIECSPLSIEVKELSIKIFKNLAQAESLIHGIPPDKVHFHEVGAFDSIVDIICFSITFQSMRIDKVITSPIALGHGSVKCQHGTYPVPAMATLELLKSVPVFGGPHHGELTTPTGAAIIKTITSEYLEALPRINIEKIGYGAGEKDLKEQPNVLRLVLGNVFESL